jgi:hypothetical protein
MKKLTFEYVYNFIKNKGDSLLSKDYFNNKTFLEIKCNKCDTIYKQNFDRFIRSPHHQHCKNIESNNTKSGYKKSIKLKPIICAQCKKEFQPNKSVSKFCSLQCCRVFQKTDENFKRNSAENGKISGRLSAARQQKRSKNEIYFSELCENYFGKEKIVTNQPYFDGWDADIIIHDYKLAILWNGIWHYKQICKTQKMSQIEARDKVKYAVILKYGYKPYVIKDLGSYNKNFVEQEFEIFLLSRMEV